MSKNLVFAVEFKATKKKHKAITKYTGYDHYHTGMVIPVNKKLYFCDLSMRGGVEDYKVQEISSLLEIEGTFDLVIFGETDEVLPYSAESPVFTDEQCNEMLQWWIDRRDHKYGTAKLLGQKNTKWMLKFSKWYYSRNKKVYQPIVDYQGDTCTIATDQCFKKKGKFDAFPK